jgi:hypothetical protein
MEVVRKLAAQRMEMARSLREAQRAAAQHHSAIEEDPTANEYGELSKLLVAFEEGDKDDSGAHSCR